LCGCQVMIAQQVRSNCADTAMRRNRLQCDRKAWPWRTDFTAIANRFHSNRAAIARRLRIHRSESTAIANRLRSIVN
jgi:hypothetical protein